MPSGSEVGGVMIIDSDDDVRAADNLQHRVRELEAAVAQLEEALASRQELGLITGVLAVRLAVTPEVAWSFVVRLSQHTNIKVRDVARILRAGYFGRTADGDRALAARLNEHLPPSIRIQLDG
jgi:ANTAR domain-containing protein